MDPPNVRFLMEPVPNGAISHARRISVDYTRR